jgi:hypothetical protein
MCPVTYPLNTALIVRKRKQIKRELEGAKGLLEIRVDVLGGATTAELVNSLDILLLSRGIRATFYESHYNHFYEDAVVDSSALVDFHPDVVYVCTASRNVQSLPNLLDTQEQAGTGIRAELERFRSVWDSLQRQIPNCTILQNNFDPLPAAGLGNLAASAVFGTANFLSRLNAGFAAAAALHAKAVPGGSTRARGQDGRATVVLPPVLV